MSEGWERINPEIAERIEYSPPPSTDTSLKDDIFFALAEGLPAPRRPWRSGTSQTAAGLPPLDRVREGFWQLYEFGPAILSSFSLMFIDRDVRGSASKAIRRRDMRAHRRAVQSCIDANALPAAVDAAPRAG